MVDRPRRVYERRTIEGVEDPYFICTLTFLSSENVLYDDINKIRVKIYLLTTITLTRDGISYRPPL